MTQGRGGAKLARYAPYCIPAFIAVWSTHVLLTRLGDPLGELFDLVLWLFASVLRLAAVAALFVTLARVHRRAHQSWQRAASAFAVWLAAGLALLLLMTATRAWWAPLLRTDAVVYFSPSAAAPGGAERFRRGWIGAWQSGLVTSAEAALLFVLCAVQSVVAFYLGGKPYRSAAGACVVVLAILVGYLAWCPWFFLDYDNFHGELIAGALVFDQIPLIASDPYSMVAAACYLTAWLACLGYLRLTSANRSWQSVPPPNPVELGPTTDEHSPVL